MESPDTFEIVNFDQNHQSIYTQWASNFINEEIDVIDIFEYLYLLFSKLNFEVHYRLEKQDTILRSDKKDLYIETRYLRPNLLHILRITLPLRIRIFWKINYNLRDKFNGTSI